MSGLPQDLGAASGVGRESDVSARSGGRSRQGRRVMHVIVGHGLPTYFLNAVSSVRALAPHDPLLVVDNASRDVRLRLRLEEIGRDDPLVTVMLRASNDLSRNAKVGGLYDAYRDAFAYAMRAGVEYVHLLQGDMQLLWWDEELVDLAAEMFAGNARCVNISTCLLTNHRQHTDALVHAATGAPSALRHYGLTDTGLFDLPRWRELGMTFDDDESLHAHRYLDAGHVVLCHPWPCDAQIPWPAVIRRGEQIGREIVRSEQFLLRPLSPDEVAALKRRPWTWLEDVCVPWGWTCLTPMWTTDLEGADYLASLRSRVRTDGLRAALPRWERRGLASPGSLAPLFAQRRPPLVTLAIVMPVRELARRLAARVRSVASARR